MFATKNPVHPDIAEALRECRRAFGSVALFSGMVNLLMLAGPLYMLQVYDRVLSSRSVPTLIALSIFLVGAYAFQGVLDLIRSRVVVRSAAVLDQRLALAVHSAVIRLSVTSRHPGDGPQPVRDLDAIRGFLTGAGPIAIVDLPWVPVFLTICFLIHPWLGVASTIGAVALFTMTLLTERASRAPAKVLAQDAGRRSVMVEAQRRGGETIMAMGMGGALAQRWAGVNNRYIAATASLSDVAGGFGSASKVLRLLLQSVILGLGAYLVIRQEMTAGAMVAASIMMGRALAPIETAIANWRAFIGARQSITRLSEALTRAAPKREVTSLPRPERSLEVEHVAIVAPGGHETRGRQRAICAQDRPGRGHHWSERGGQDLPGTRPRGHLAASQGMRAARWRRARPVGSGPARPACRLHLADGRIVRRHHLREHRPDERQAGCRCRAARGQGRRRARA